MSEDKIITIRMPEETWRKLQMMRINGEIKSMNAYINELIKQAVEAVRKDRRLS
jgi:hypothetical protein